MINDAAKLVATSEACQKCSHRYRAPAQHSQLIAPSWLLQRWGIDVMVKLTLAQGNYTFAIIMVKYFTKWVDLYHYSDISLAKHHLLLRCPSADNRRQS
jgi:hypothetical protein